MYFLRTLGLGGGGVPKGLVHNLLVQFFTLAAQKSVKASERCFFGMVTTHNDHPGYVKHVLGCIYVFFTGIGCVGGGGSLHSLLVQFFTLGSSKIEVSERCFFFYMVTTHNHHPSYVKHVLGSIYVFF